MVWEISPQPRAEGILKNICSWNHIKRLIIELESLSNYFSFFVTLVLNLFQKIHLVILPQQPIAISDCMVISKNWWKGLYYSYNFRSNFCNFLIQCPIFSQIEVHFKPKLCILLNIQKSQTYKSVSHWAAEYEKEISRVTYPLIRATCPQKRSQRPLKRAKDPQKPFARVQIIALMGPCILVKK